jgi:hypothetical protein
MYYSDHKCYFQKRLEYDFQTVRSKPLKPEVLATWESEIRRISVPGQPQAKNFMRPHLKEKSWVW